MNLVALVLPIEKEINPPEGEGGYDPGENSEDMHHSVSNYGGRGYESGQSSQVGGGHGDSGDGGVLYR